MLLTRLTSGNATVDFVGNIDITGNVTPLNWYKRILRENGKPNLLAIALLSDIVYWYRPAEIKDKISGNTIAWKKKFRGMMLQKSYKDYADRFGESKRSIKAALDYLEDIGVIKKGFADYITETNSKIPNIMYIDLVPQKLKELTLDEESEDEKIKGKEEQELECCETDDDLEKFIENDDNNSDLIELSFGKRGATNFCTTPYNEMQHPIQNGKGKPTLKRNTSLHNSVVPPTTVCGTNTKNTTEIINKDEYKSINLSNPNASAREIEKYKSIVANNINLSCLLDTAKELGEDEVAMVHNIYDTICDMVCYPRSFVTISETKYPWDTVKSRYLKLTYANIADILNRLPDENLGIKKMPKYLRTTLYNASLTGAIEAKASINDDYLKSLRGSPYD